MEALAAPNSSIRMSGKSCCAAETSRSGASTFLCAWLLSPARTKVTRAECPSVDRSPGLLSAPGAANGLWISATVGIRRSRDTTSVTAAANESWLRAVPGLGWTRTSSRVWYGKAA